MASKTVNIGISIIMRTYLFQIMEVVQEIIGQVDITRYYLDLLCSVRADLIDAMPWYVLISD